MHSDTTPTHHPDPGEIAERLRRDDSPGLVEDLRRLPDELKVAVVQRFFQHVEEGSHATSFDRRTVSRLLAAWFGIRLDPGRPAAGAGRSAPPGRAGHPEVCHVDFGGTDLFLHLSPEAERAAADLVETVATDAVLSVATTSPPCELAEFVPRWLQDRGRPAPDYYLSGRADHPLAGYFDRVTEAVRAELGVTMEERSTEMAIVANADALRYHRDRLVNQYARLAAGGADPAAYRVVQELTLIDWDMQPGTFSGTVLDHPGGDRFVLLLDPGEVAGFFFSEPVRMPGPMMMPYHCALPVLDRSAARTVGPAKGKRLSALVRGLAPGEQIEALRGRATGLALDASSAGGPVRRCAAGIEASAVAGLPATRLAPLAVPENDEGLSVVELDAARNAELLDAVAPGAGQRARLFRVEKHGEGFSSLARALPGLSGRSRLVLVDRSAPGEGSGRAFPLTLDRTTGGLPWLHLPALPENAVVRVPGAAAGLVHLTPPDELLHRSALLDSFHPATRLGGRPRVALDVVVA
jgi:hypothetical protein